MVPRPPAPRGRPSPGRPASQGSGLSRAEYEKNWGTVYKKPGLFTQILAFIIGWIPKIGPLKILTFKIPTAETEDLYIKSVNKTVENYSALLRQVNDEGFGLPGEVPP